MVGLKPLTNISERVANYVKFAGKESVYPSMPVKSTFKGLKLALLQKDTLTLSPQPKRYASQGERLKDFYNSKGIPYLLPNEEWSDKKIFDTINLLGKDLDKLIESKTLNKQTLQDTIEKLAPEVKGKIEIKDFRDLENDLRAQGYSESAIKDYFTTASAVTDPTNKGTSIYFKFEKANKDKQSQTIFKLCVEHEIKHALSSTLQNTALVDIYKNDFYKCHNQNKVFDELFHKIEERYTPSLDLAQTSLNQKNMLKSLGFKSMKELNASFKSSLARLIAESEFTGKFNLGSDKNSWKQFFNYLKNMAKDEKEAYKSNVRYRENYNNLKTPTVEEFEPLKYKAMEKFFEKERIQVNKQINY